jgi:hypothetical protein
MGGTSDRRHPCCLGASLLETITLFGRLCGQAHGGQDLLDRVLGLDQGDEAQRAFAARADRVGNGTENGEVGMVGGQSMGQLLSKDSGAREWKHASRSAAATP